MHNANVFFENLTGKHFHDWAYKLHFLQTDLPMLHERAFFHKNSAIIDLSRMLSYTVCYKKINNATVKFVVFSQQPSSPDLCVNIAHIGNETFCCVTKYIKFASFFSSFYYMLLLNAFKIF